MCRSAHGFVSTGRVHGRHVHLGSDVDGGGIELTGFNSAGHRLSSWASQSSSNRGRRVWVVPIVIFLIGIAAGAQRRHHSQVRNSPWTMFFNGVLPPIS